MKSTRFLSTFLLIIFVKINRGQQNGFAQKQIVETNNNLSQQQPTNTMVSKSIQRFLNQNGNAGALPNKIDQNQVQIHKNILQSSSDLQQIQQPLDMNQPLQLQQVLQQQQPLQFHQSLQLLQSSPLQPTLQPQQPLQQQQLLQSQPAIQEFQQPPSLQQISQQLAPGFQPNVDLPQPSSLHQHNSPASLNSHLQLQPLQLQEPINVGEPLYSQNLIIQPQNNPVHPVEGLNTPQSGGFSTQDVSSIIYYGSPQQSATPLTENSRVSSHDPSIALIPSFNIKSHDQAYVPPYNYIKPSTEVQTTVGDRTKPISSVPALPSVLTIPPVPTTNLQTYYYNPPAVDSRQNVYINQNSPHYPQQPKIQVTPVQAQSAAVIPSQASIFSTLPLSIIQTPSVFPQYGISSDYPIKTIVAPAYTSKRSTPSNLKSLLPIIFNLLKERIASCGCQNSCPCDCKNKSINNELEVSSGYSSLKNYGALKEDAFSGISTASEELEVSACPRERKNLKSEEEVSEVSDEILKDDSEEEFDDDEEED